MKVHSVLGPGLLEEVYKACLRHELQKRNVNVLSEVGLPVLYDDMTIDVGFRIDLLVENKLIVELKSVHALALIHKAQLLNYLKLSKIKLGLLLNFNCQHLKDGIVRLINPNPLRYFAPLCGPNFSNHRQQGESLVLSR